MEENRIEKVEIKLSYLEDMVSQLNDIVIAQQREVGDLRSEVDALQKKVKELMEEEGEDIPNRRPPHY